MLGPGHWGFEFIGMLPQLGIADSSGRLFFTLVRSQLANDTPFQSRRRVRYNREGLSPGLLSCQMVWISKYGQKIVFNCALRLDGYSIRISLLLRWLKMRDGPCRMAIMLPERCSGWNGNLLLLRRLAKKGI